MAKTSGLVLAVLLAGAGAASAEDCAPVLANLKVTHPYTAILSTTGAPGLAGPTVSQVLWNGTAYFVARDGNWVAANDSGPKPGDLPLPPANAGLSCKRLPAAAINDEAAAAHLLKVTGTGIAADITVWISKSRSMLLKTKVALPNGQVTVMTYDYDHVPAL